MRFKFIFLLFSFSSSFAQINSNDQFLQEIATVFTLDDGLPETVFSEIRLDEFGNIIAASTGGEFTYDGNRWKIFSKPLSDVTKEKKDLDEDVLSAADYQQKVVAG